MCADQVTIKKDSGIWIQLFAAFWLLLKIGLLNLLKKWLILVNIRNEIQIFLCIFASLTENVKWSSSLIS